MPYLLGKNLVCYNALRLMFSWLNCASPMSVELYLNRNVNFAYKKCSSTNGYSIRPACMQTCKGDSFFRHTMGEAHLQCFLRPLAISTPSSTPRNSCGKVWTIADFNIKTLVCLSKGTLVQHRSLFSFIKANIWISPIVNWCNFIIPV